MFTESVPEPALQVLTTNSEGTPAGIKRQEIKIKILLEQLGICAAVTKSKDTCGSSLQSCAVCRHHAWVSDQTGVSHPHVEGASGNVAPIELDIDGMHSVLPWNEADGILV